MNIEIHNQSCPSTFSAHSPDIARIRQEIIERIQFLQGREHHMGMRGIEFLVQIVFLIRSGKPLPHLNETTHLWYRRILSRYLGDIQQGRQHKKGILSPEEWHVLSAHFSSRPF